MRRCACPALLGQESTTRTCGRESRERERESSYGDSKRWVTHEKREGAIERTKTLMQTPFFRHLIHACMCTSTKMCKCDCARAMCRKLWVQQVSVCTHTVVHGVVVLHVYETLKALSRKFCQEKNEHSSLHDLTPWPSWPKTKSSIRRLVSEPFKVRLDLSCWYLCHQLAFHQSLWVEASRFPEACVSESPTFLISWFSAMPLY